jgi:hypothetical protein
MQSIKVGTWHEESRKITAHTCYAADYINHLSKAGDYDAFLVAETGGFKIHMPQSLSIKLDTVITDGKYFNGFCGNNFSSDDVETGDSTYTLHFYSYMIQELVASGRLVLDSGFEWLNQDTDKVLDYIRSTGWKIV